MLLKPTRRQSLAWLAATSLPAWAAPRKPAPGAAPPRLGITVPPLAVSLMAGPRALARCRPQSGLDIPL